MDVQPERRHHHHLWRQRHRPGHARDETGQRERGARAALHGGERVSLRRRRHGPGRQRRRAVGGRVRARHHRRRGEGRLGPPIPLVLGGRRGDSRPAHPRRLRRVPAGHFDSSRQRPRLPDRTAQPDTERPHRGNAPGLHPRLHPLLSSLDDPLRRLPLRSPRSRLLHAGNRLDRTLRPPHPHVRKRQPRDPRRRGGDPRRRQPRLRAARLPRHHLPGHDRLQRPQRAVLVGRPCSRADERDPRRGLRSGRRGPGEAGPGRQPPPAHRLLPGRRPQSRDPQLGRGRGAGRERRRPLRVPVAGELGRLVDLPEQHRPQQRRARDLRVAEQLDTPRDRRLHRLLQREVGDQARRLRELVRLPQPDAPGQRDRDHLPGPGRAR